MPSERKVLSEFIENENIVNSDQNVLGPVEYMMGEIAFGANAENVNSAVGDDPGIKPQACDFYQNDALIVKPAYDHSLVFVNTPDFSQNLEANGHIGKPHLLLNHPPVHGHGLCCMCPCHQVAPREPQTLGPPHCTGYPPSVGGTFHVVCFSPPALPPQPLVPSSPDQQGWAGGGSVLR